MKDIVGNYVWIRSDLKLNDTFQYISGGTYYCVRDHLKFAGMKVLVRRIHPDLSEFFCIGKGRGEVWFHVDMIDWEATEPMIDIDQSLLLNLIGG